MKASLIALSIVSAMSVAGPAYAARYDDSQYYRSESRFGEPPAPEFSGQVSRHCREVVADPMQQGTSEFRYCQSSG